ncbi:MAG: hypothetical protein PF486_06045 [Prolixibacteraceae bacterium]|jgi:hypothetical protein|nr:hypothetical protein [Prolixibacteraceae bacterium]
MKKATIITQMFIMIFIYNIPAYGQTIPDNVEMVKKELTSAGKCKINVNGDTIYIVVTDDSRETHTTYHIINETADVLIGDYITWSEVVEYLQTGKIK